MGGHTRTATNWRAEACFLDEYLRDAVQIWHRCGNHERRRTLKTKMSERPLPAQLSEAGRGIGCCACGCFLSDRATRIAEIERRVACRSAYLQVPLLFQVARFGNGNLLVRRPLSRGLCRAWNQGGKTGDRSQDQI